MRQILRFSAIAMTLSLSAEIYAGEPETADYHDELTRLTVGSFSTLEHAKGNTGYGVAEAEIVEIWPDENPAETWFYQEQALLGETSEEIDPAKKNRPYFARVIRSVETEPGVVRRSIHKVKDAESARGAWRKDTPLSGLSVKDLMPSECSIAVTRIAVNFWRSESEKCPNGYKGAEYALSLGIVTDTGYANWDRGFSSDGAVVWGPVSGGYVFRRITGEAGSKK